MDISSRKRYTNRGVSAQKEDVHNAIKSLDKGLFEKTFCKIVPDYLSNSLDHCLVMHADGGGNNSDKWRKTYIIAFRDSETIKKEREIGFTHSHNDQVDWEKIISI